MAFDLAIIPNSQVLQEKIIFMTGPTIGEHHTGPHGQHPEKRQFPEEAIKAQNVSEEFYDVL